MVVVINTRVIYSTRAIISVRSKTNYSVRGNAIDLNGMPMTLLNATKFIMRQQRYLLQDNENVAADVVQQISDNEGTYRGIVSNVPICVIYSRNRL